MNLPLPIIAGVVALAAGAAAFRAAHHSPQPAPFTRESQGPISRHAHHARGAAAPREHIVIYVAGEVQRGGIYTLPFPARAIDAVRAAGGTTPNADLVAVNLAQPLSDGDEVAVPALGETVPSASHRRTSHRTKRPHRRAKGKHRHRRHHRAEGVSGAAGDASTDATSDAGTAESGEPTSVVDLNTADENELETLPGVGATLAERIVAFRELTGPFASTDDLLDVSGITQAKLDEISPFVKAEIQENAP